MDQHARAGAEMDGDAGLVDRLAGFVDDRAGDGCG